MADSKVARKPSHVSENTLFDILRYQYYDCLALCIIAALLLTFIY